MNAWNVAEPHPCEPPTRPGNLFKICLFCRWSSFSVMNDYLNNLSHLTEFIFYIVVYYLLFIYLEHHIFNGFWTLTCSYLIWVMISWFHDERSFSSKNKSKIGCWVGCPYILYLCQLFSSQIRTTWPTLSTGTVPPPHSHVPLLHQAPPR